LTGRDIRAKMAPGLAGRDELSVDAASASAPLTDAAAIGGGAVRRMGRMPALDGLRGVAVLTVFVAHFEIILPINRVVAIPGANVPLDMFFVLSGFLITTLLLREQSRLLPPLFLFLAGQMLFAYLTSVPWHLEWTSVLSVVFYYENFKLALNSNFLGGIIAPGLQHLWSLSLEEQFYMVWPFVTIFLLTIRTRLRTVTIVLGSLILAIAVMRGVMYDGPNTWYRLFVSTHTHADGILVGCLLAHWWIRGREPQRFVRGLAWVSVLFLLWCLARVDLLGSFLYRGGLVGIEIACAIIVLALVQGQWSAGRFFRLRLFVVLGTVSYAFYLWHLLVLAGVRQWGMGWSEPVRVIVATVVTLFFTAVSWFLLEKPSLDWKDRLEGRTPPPRFGVRELVGRSKHVEPEAPRGFGPPPGSTADAPTGGREPVR
jgi:peptidoglycan/LPS O-acetylase OafA/YrhL